MLSNKKTEKFFERHENRRTVFFERQNSSGGLRPPQQSMIQTISNDVICIRHDAAEAGDLRYL